MQMRSLVAMWQIIILGAEEHFKRPALKSILSRSRIPEVRQTVAVIWFFGKKSVARITLKLNFSSCPLRFGYSYRTVVSRSAKTWELLSLQSVLRGG